MWSVAHWRLDSVSGPYGSQAREFPYFDVRSTHFFNKVTGVLQSIRAGFGAADDWNDFKDIIQQVLEHGHHTIYYPEEIV